MTLPTLYKTNKNGSIQTYIVSTSGDTITVSQGQLNGKMQSYPTICLPKNLGRSNATTGAEQAILESKSKFNKKIKSGYSLNKLGTIEIELAMKVKAYKDNIKNIIFPCITNLKLNGINAIYRLENNELNLYSRGGNLYPIIPHLENDIRKIMKQLNTNALAGELYIHEMHLQDITSLVKKPKLGSENLEFHIFDLPNSIDIYESRARAINQIKNTTHVFKVSQEIANSHEELDELHTHAVEFGYEGIVIYNSNGTYEYNVRSSNVFKMKKALDAEFLVTDFRFDKYNHVVYDCETSEGMHFLVKRKGTAEERLYDASIAKSNIGKWLTVEFETYSKPRLGNKLGVPLKPVGLNFRLCNEKGEPIE